MIMFGAEYILAFIKIFFNIAFAIVTAVPFKIAWNCVASNYLTAYIPEQFANIPYWHMVAILLTCTFVGEMIQHLTPTIVKVNQTNTNTDSDNAK